MTNEVKFGETPGYADLFDLTQWDDMRRRGWIIPSDGSGYWAKDEGKQESNIGCFAPRPEWATHVAWYNR